MDNNPSLRLWAEKYNELLHGSLNRYLMGTESLEEALLEVVERLYLQQDLSLIRFYLDRAMKDLTDDPEHKVSLEYLEHIHTLVENKIVARVTGTTPESPAAPFGDGYGILSDRAIRRLSGEGGMIEPFNERQVTRTEGKPSISHGLSSYGYDARVAPEFKVFTNVYGAEIDPKNFDPQSFVDVRANAEGFIRVPPNSFALGRTMEYFRIPRDVLVICLGKSTYARCGIIVNVTPLEPEWEGHVTLEFSNTTPLPARIYAGEGACQFIFLRGSDPCETSYRDRGGKYQGQTGVTPPRMK